MDNKVIDVPADIQFGEIGEEIVMKVLETVKLCFFKGSNRDYKYDLLIAAPHKTRLTKVEVKTDKLAYKGINIITGKEYTNCWNVWVEHTWKGNPSGINKTESDVWINYFIQTGEVWMINTNKLKKLIADNDFNTVGGGDNGAALGYQIPKEKFREHFQIITINDAWLEDHGFPTSEELVKSNAEKKEA